MEGSNLALGGHVLFIRYRQGMTAFLVIALLHHTEGVTVTNELDVAAARHLDLSSLNMAARINLTEW
ncbi:MAG TPA: nucleoid-associated protein YejK, partial [Pseudomonas sp.]|nr:nucleoid-associated protein YejK [Pseudomonas sp.]